jgi:hypothetical protein
MVGGYKTFRLLSQCVLQRIKTAQSGRKKEKPMKETNTKRIKALVYGVAIGIGTYMSFADFTSWSSNDVGTGFFATVSQSNWPQQANTIAEYYGAGLTLQGRKCGFHSVTGMSNHEHYLRYDTWMDMTGNWYASSGYFLCRSEVWKDGDSSNNIAQSFVNQ